MWTDDSFSAPAVLEDGSRFLTATYTVAADTPAGEYTVREITHDWTWTYEDTSAKEDVKVKANEDNKVTFEHKHKTVDWLHGESHN
jgi:hypothetical protein